MSCVRPRQAKELDPPSLRRAWLQAEPAPICPVRRPKYPQKAALVLVINTEIPTFTALPVVSCDSYTAWQVDVGGGNSSKVAWLMSTGIGGTIDENLAVLAHPSILADLNLLMGLELVMQKQPVL
jgi:hypothetical protein